MGSPRPRERIDAIGVPIVKGLAIAEAWRPEPESREAGRCHEGRDAPRQGKQAGRKTPGV